MKLHKNFKKTSRIKFCGEKILETFSIDEPYVKGKKWSPRVTPMKYLDSFLDYHLGLSVNLTKWHQKTQK